MRFNSVIRGSAECPIVDPRILESAAGGQSLSSRVAGISEGGGGGGGGSGGGRSPSDRCRRGGHLQPTSHLRWSRQPGDWSSVRCALCGRRPSPPAGQGGTSGSDDPTEPHSLRPTQSLPADCAAIACVSAAAYRSRYTALTADRRARLERLYRYRYSTRARPVRAAQSEPTDDTALGTEPREHRRPITRRVRPVNQTLRPPSTRLPGAETHAHRAPSDIQLTTNIRSCPSVSRVGAAGNTSAVGAAESEESGAGRL